jgi:hypothetical protein
MMNDRSLEIFRNFKPRPCDAWFFEIDSVRLQLEQQILFFPVMALPSLDKPVALCGVVHAHGVGEMWMVTGEGFERKAPVIRDQQRGLCAAAVVALKLHRLHMMIESSRDDAKKWAEELGFRFEHGPVKSLSARNSDLDIYLWEGN